MQDIILVQQPGFSPDVIPTPVPGYSTEAVQTTSDAPSPWMLLDGPSLPEQQNLIDAPSTMTLMGRSTSDPMADAPMAAACPAETCFFRGPFHCV